MKGSLRRAAGSVLVVGLGATELTGLERAWLRLVRPGGVILFRRNIAAAAQTRALLDEATGLGAPELTGLERAWLRLGRPGGVILFRRNIVDAAQTRALLDEATGLGAAHGVRCVDVEGGTVNRLRDALAAMPSAQAVCAASHPMSPDAKDEGHQAPGILGEQASSFPTRSRERTARWDGAPTITVDSASRSPVSKSRPGAPRSLSEKFPSLARVHGELVARAVKAFGFNTTLAPVVDLVLPESVEVMGTRAPAADPAQVTEFAREFLVGLLAKGVAGCGKHFPGLGGAEGDTHFVTPAIRRTWPQIWDEDLTPYRALHAAMPMIMTNHAAYPETKGGMAPASASRFWITKVLRERIGYEGIILSDDLEMGGILKFLPVEDAAVEAVRAGSDLLEICHSAELILRSFEALIVEGERSAAFRELLLERARSCERKRTRLYAGGVAKALTAKQMEKLKEEIGRFRERVAAITSAQETEARASSPAERT